MKTMFIVIDKIRELNNEINKLDCCIYDGKIIDKKILGRLRTLRKILNERVELLGD